MILNESNIILAINNTSDLAKSVLAYLYSYREFCNGVNNIRIPTHKFCIKFGPQLKQGYVTVTIVCRWSESTSETREVGGGYGFGCGDDDDGSDISTEVVYYTDHYSDDRTIHIPISCLLDENMRDTHIALKKKDDADYALKIKNQKIKDLENQLLALKS